MSAPILVLTRNALRRDRVIASVWVFLLLVTCFASAAATPGLYHSVTDRVAASEAINHNAAVVALYGPIMDVTSIGELSMTKMTALYAVFVGLLMLVVLRRHARLDEERGSLELIAATGAGRTTPLHAALVEGLLLALVIGVGAAVANIVGGLATAGSLVFGLAWAGTAVVALGVGALANQLSASARTAGGIGVCMLLGLYALRAFGDTGWIALSWLSPFGWNTQLRAWSEPRWWVLLLYPITAGVLISVALTLERRRDLGAGVIAARRGRAEAPAWLRGPMSLTWRTQRGGLVAWTVGMALGGLMMGAIAPGVGKLLAGTDAAEMMRRLGGPGVLADTLLAAEFGILALIVSGFAIGVVTHAAEDERMGLAEHLRSTPMRRAALWSSTTAFIAAGSVWLLVVAGSGAALGAGESWSQMVGATLVQTPAIGITAAITLLAWSVKARYAAYGWGALAGFVVVGMVGELLKLPSWAIKLSPYTHIPKLPAETMAWSGVTSLAVISCATLGLSYLVYRRRDVG